MWNDFRKARGLKAWSIRNQAPQPAGSCHAQKGTGPPYDHHRLPMDAGKHHCCRMAVLSPFAPDDPNSKWRSCITPRWPDRLHCNDHGAWCSHRPLWHSALQSVPVDRQLPEFGTIDPHRQQSSRSNPAEQPSHSMPQEHTSAIDFTMNEEMISRADLRSAPHPEVCRRFSEVTMLRTTTTLAAPSVAVPAKEPVVDRTPFPETSELSSRRSVHRHMGTISSCRAVSRNRVGRRI